MCEIGSLWNKRNMNWLLFTILEFVGNGGIFYHFLSCFFFFFFFLGLFSANSRFPNSSGYGESFLWQVFLVINVFMMIKTWNSCIIRPGLSRLEWWVGRPIQWFYFWWAVSLLWALVEVDCISNGGDSRLINLPCQAPAQHFLCI